MQSGSNRRQTLLGLAGLTLVAGCSAHSATGNSDAEESATTPQAEPDLSALVGKTVRVVPKGGMMTMDYREDRLTILLDENDRIERAYVG